MCLCCCGCICRKFMCVDMISFIFVFGFFDGDVKIVVSFESGVFEVYVCKNIELDLVIRVLFDVGVWEKCILFDGGCLSV